MENFIHLFETDAEFTDYLNSAYKEPFVSYTIEANRVDYNQNSYAFSLFEKIFCENVNEDDIEVFRNIVVSFIPSVYEMRQTYYGQISFNAGTIEGEHYSQPALVCDVPSVELTEEQYNEISGMSNDERINVLLPLLECQGDANHQWFEPPQPQ